MIIELTEAQRNAINSEHDSPIRLIDPKSGRIYVLLQESVFERIQSIVSEDLTDTYRAQMESAMRAGWDAPEMDAYDDYEKHRSV